jgi:FkbM family methyltransferase
MAYYSQYGQDKLLYSLTEHKRNGVFIDIGAHDGIRFSNTYFFESELEWTGICIEPHPKVFPKLKENRKCIIEGCAISDVEGEFDFIAADGYPEMNSGFNRKEIIEKQIKEQFGSYEIAKVPTFRLDTILTKHNISKADICSIDVETHEIHVVKSLDWSKYDIEWVCIEANIGIEKVLEYLSPYYKTYAKIIGDLILKRIR